MPNGDAAANVARGAAATAMRTVRDGGRLATITSDQPEPERGIDTSSVYVRPDAGQLELAATALAALIERMRGLMPDWRQCAGALTVFEAGSEAEARMLAANAPWQAVFTGRLFGLERAIFRRVLPPAGPNTQRYGGASPWPGGTFD